MSPAIFTAIILARRRCRLAASRNSLGVHIRIEIGDRTVIVWPDGYIAIRVYRGTLGFQLTSGYCNADDWPRLRRALHWPVARFLAHVPYATFSSSDHLFDEARTEPWYTQLRRERRERSATLQRTGA